ncbi:MAG: hypothetical protein RL333_1052 [Pseudomonadota bacterium]
MRLSSTIHRMLQGLLIGFFLGLPVLAMESAPEAFTAEDRRILEQGFQGMLRYHPIASEALDEPRALLAPEDSSHLYRVLPEGGAASEELHRYSGGGAEAEGVSRFEYQLNADESQFLELSEGQGVRIVGALDRKEGVRTEFQPPKPLLPKGLMPGQSVTATCKVRVLDLAHPDKVRHSGELSVTLTHLGNFHARVPAGEYDTTLVRLDSRGKVGPAEIMHRQYYFYAEDTGLVGFLESRRISAFAIYEKKQQQALVLQREGDGP